MNYEIFAIFVLICIVCSEPHSAVKFQLNKNTRVLSEVNSYQSSIPKSERTQNQLSVHQADTLLLSCMDFRLIDDMVKFMNNEGFNNNYDDYILAGASLGYNQQTYPGWKKSFDAHLGLAIKLHEVHEVVVIDHEKCGAYKLFYPNVDFTTLSNADEKALHAENIRLFKNSIQAVNPNIDVYGYYIHLNSSTETLTCNPQCKTCSGINEFECLSCFDNLKLVGGNCVLNPVNLTLFTYLERTSDPMILNIKMYPRVPSFVNSINKFTTISLGNNQYQSLLDEFIDQDDDTIQIRLKYSSNLPPNTFIFINYTIAAIADNSQTNGGVYYLTPTNLSGSLLEYMPYNEDQKAFIGTAQTIAISASIASQVSIAFQSVINFQSASAYILIQSCDLFYAVKFLNVTFPPNIMQLFGRLKNQPVTLTFLPNVFNQISENPQLDSAKTALGNFDLYNVKPWIMYNFGAEFLQFIVIVIAAFVFIGIKALRINLHPNVKHIVLKVYYILVWNFIISYVLSNYFKGIMFMMINFEQPTTGTSYQQFNLAMNIIFIVLIPVPFIAAAISLKYYKNQQHKVKKNHPEDIKSLVSDFSNDHLIQALYLSLSLIRGFFIFSFIVWLNDYPKTTLILWLILTSGIIIITIVFRPYVKQRHTLKQSGCEILNLVFYAMALAIANKNIEDSQGRSDIGFMMLVTSSIFIIWITIFSYVDLVISIYEGIKNAKEVLSKNAKKIAEKKENSDNEKGIPENEGLVFNLKGEVILTPKSVENSSIFSSKNPQNRE